MRSGSEPREPAKETSKALSREQAWGRSRTGRLLPPTPRRASGRATHSRGNGRASQEGTPRRGGNGRAANGRGGIGNSRAQKAAPEGSELREPLAESLQAAAAEGLLFTCDRDPGFRRVRRGRGFIYLSADGEPVVDEAHLARIRKLAIPPAYREVWVCASPRGHLQATGYDARGRKQYRYHARWRSHRDAQKFDHILEFGRALPRIRRRVAQDLRKQGLPRERVLATVVRLLDMTLVRVGNEEYARANHSFGLTTLRNRHVSVNGATLHFEFRGKSGILHRVTVSDPALARIVRRCADIPGQELFQWIDSEGGRHRIDSNDVNEYLREAAGEPLTAKDFRTWFATIEALAVLRKLPVGSQRDVKRQLKSVVNAVAERLGNTPAICRKCYIHPEVLQAYSEGRLAPVAEKTTVAALNKLLRKHRRKAR